MCGILKVMLNLRVKVSLEDENLDGKYFSLRGGVACTHTFGLPNLLQKWAVIKSLIFL